MNICICATGSRQHQQQWHILLHNTISHCIIHFWMDCEITNRVHTYTIVVNRPERMKRTNAHFSLALPRPASSFAIMPRNFLCVLLEDNCHFIYGIFPKLYYWWCAGENLVADKAKKRAHAHRQGNWATSVCVCERCI